MDGDRFDTLTKTLMAGAGPRRAALRLLAGFVLTAGLARFGRAEAKRGRRRRRKKKDRCGLGQRACGGACIPFFECCVAGRRLPHGGRHQYCGLCQAGSVVWDADLAQACRQSDPEGCSGCDAPTFRCEAISGVLCVPEGAENCGICSGGRCDTSVGGRPCGSDDCCFDDEECCQGECRSPCPALETRDPQTCECGCPGAPRAGRVGAAQACCPDGRPLCGEGAAARCCSSVHEVCCAGECCHQGEGKCTKDGCCRPVVDPQDPTGGFRVPCCDGVDCSQDPCCGPEEQCCQDAESRWHCCPSDRNHTFGCCFGGCCGAGTTCNGDCFHATGRACCPEGNSGTECDNCAAPTPGRR